MSQNYSRKLLQISLAQICQNLGWNAIQSTPLEILTDILERYMLEMAKVTHRYSEQFGRTSPNLIDVGLAFQQFGVHMEELENYVRHMDPVPFAHPVVAFPVPKRNNLQLPNLDSKEIRQREEHIFEYLPAMFPGMEEESEPIMSPPPNSGMLTPQHESPSAGVHSSPVAGDKYPISSPGEGPVFKRPKIITSSLPDEAGHSQYEMMNVSMSQTGFLTPTRGQGKLPDARTPPPTNVIIVVPKVAKTSDSLEKKSKEIPISTTNLEKKKSQSSISKKISPGGVLNLTNNALPVDKMKKIPKISSNPVLKIKEVKKKISKLSRSPLVTKPKQKSPGRPPKKAKTSSKESKLKELLLITAEKKTDANSEKRSKSSSPSPMPSKSVAENVDETPQVTAKVEKGLQVQQIKSEQKDTYESPDDDDSSGSRLVIAENVGKGKLSKEAKQARSAAIMESIDSVIKQSSQDSRKNPKRETTYLVKEDGSMIKIGEKINVRPVSKGETDKKSDSDIDDSESIEVKEKLTADLGKKGDSKTSVKYSTVESINASIDSVIFQSSSKVISEEQIKSEVTDEDTFPYAGTPDRSTPSTPTEEKEIKEESEESKSKDKDQGIRDKLKEKLKKKSSSQDSEESVSKKKSMSLDSEESDIFSGTEKSTKGPISIYDFPESPPTRSFHLQSSSRTSSESMDVPARKSEINSEKRKEKVKEKSKDKQHKKDKKDRRKDKEKKKKNKNRDKHRADRSKEEFDDSPIPVVPRIKLNIRIGSSPSVSPAVSISTESRFSSPKAEPSPSSTPTRPEIPKLVIKPILPQTPTADVKPVVLSPPNSAPVTKTTPITPSRRGRPPKRRGQRGRRPGSPAVARRFSAPFEFKTGGTATVKEETHLDHEDDGINQFPLPSLVSSDKTQRAMLPMSIPSSFNLVCETKPKIDQLQLPSSDHDASKASPPVVSPPRNTSLSPVHSSPSLPLTPANNPSPSSPSLPPQSPSPPPRSPSPRPQSRTPSPPHTPSPAASHTTSPPCSPPASPDKSLPISPKKEAPDIPPMPPPSIASSSAIPPMPPPSKAGLTKQRTVITETVATYEDASGDKIWICPGCEQPDDGSPMIGCDSCDEWYHWPCVNIVSEPREDENWYCPKCNPTRKQPRKKAIAPKKRGRKKKP